MSNNCYREIDKNYANLVVELLIEQYEKLPKTGKPTTEEWTVVAAIVEENSMSLRVVALGTGSKCLGRSLLSPRGDVINDAHAEVMARRGFLLYLMDEAQAWYQTGVSKVFTLRDGKLAIKTDLRYIFVSSSVPCGDAAIIPKNIDTLIRKRRNAASNSEEAPESTDGAAKRQRVDDLLDVHRTGAKCLPGAADQDPKEAGIKYHVTGQVRTKPGRGDPTASVSCSDKLARWNAVGLQGALLSLLIHQPVRFSCIIIAGGVPYSEDSLERAVNLRIGAPKKIRFLQSQVTFPVTKNDVRIRPAPCSISWSLPSNHSEVCVEGRRQGATKAKTNKSLLVISKANLHKRFLELLSIIPALPTTLVECELSKLSYRQLKSKSAAYQESWKFVKDNYFKMWTEKPPGIEDFLFKR